MTNQNDKATAKDLIAVERKVFLDLIAAADKARECLASRTSGGDQFALKQLYTALLAAIREEGGK